MSLASLGPDPGTTWLAPILNEHLVQALHLFLQLFKVLSNHAPFNDDKQRNQKIEEEHGKEQPIDFRFNHFETSFPE
jgi:hypothetical protein